MRKFILLLLLVLVLAVISFMIFMRIQYGGGKEYPDLSTPPLYSEEQVELFYSHPEPVGNVAATPDTSRRTRVFFTIHPESRPDSVFLLEIVEGNAIPYPDAGSQKKLFQTALGVFADNQQRLWTIDHGNHGFGEVKLTAFDLASDQIVHEHIFTRDVGERLSFFNDLTVTPDGRYVFIADVSFFGKSPALVIYDTQTGDSRRLLDSHPSVTHEGYVPVTPVKKMRFLGGMIDLLTGIDGIDVSRDGRYLYWAPMGSSGLFMLPVSTATDFSLPEKDIEKEIVRVADKPLSDGIRTDRAGNVYITDIEHQGVYVVQPDGRAFTLIRDERIRWADGLSLGGDGYFYLADSDIPDQMLQSSHMAREAPYHIFRFRSLPDEGRQPATEGPG